MGYLLVLVPVGRLVRFLARAGFTRENPGDLLAAVRQLASEAEAEEDGTNEFGVFFRADGSLTGPNGRPLAVATVWIRREYPTGPSAS